MTTTEEALVDGWPLIHYDSRVHDSPLHATVTPGSVHVGQAVIARDAHTQHHCFALVTALDIERSKATLHLYAQTETPASTHKHTS